MKVLQAGIGLGGTAGALWLLSSTINGVQEMAAETRADECLYAAAQGLNMPLNLLPYCAAEHAARIIDWLGDFPSQIETFEQLFKAVEWLAAWLGIVLVGLMLLMLWLAKSKVFTKNIVDG